MNIKLPQAFSALMLAILLSACGGDTYRDESIATKPDVGKTPVIRCAP
jgi:hypothetical protein